jgi:hypothetical protein
MYIIQRCFYIVPWFCLTCVPWVYSVVHSPLLPHLWLEDGWFSCFCHLLFVSPLPVRITCNMPFFGHFVILTLAPTQRRRCDFFFCRYVTCPYMPTMYTWFSSHWRPYHYTIVCNYGALMPHAHIQTPVYLLGMYSYSISCSYDSYLDFFCCCLLFCWFFHCCCCMTYITLLYYHICFMQSWCKLGGGFLTDSVLIPYSTQRSSCAYAICVLPPTLRICLCLCILCSWFFLCTSCLTFFFCHALLCICIPWLPL